MKQQILHPGEVYALQEKETGKWFTFQILQIDGEKAVHVDLDYWSDKFPEESDLKNMAYLRKNHHFWTKENEINYSWVPIKWFPSNAKLIGSMPIVPLEECRAYSTWTDGCQQKWQERWNKLPKDQTNAYRDAETRRNETVIVGGQEKKYCLFGVFDDTLSAISDFSELDKLPGLGRICTSKDYPQLIPFLERRYLIQELNWDNCQRKELDLSRTHLENIEISGKDVELIKLPSGIHKLILKGELSPNLRIISPKDGYYLELWVELHDDFLPDVGLSRLWDMHLRNIKDFSLKKITSRFPNLARLWMTGKPGYVHDMAELSKLHGLERLWIEDIFGFNADEFPRHEDIPELRFLIAQSIPADAGKVIKKLYKGKIPDLDFSVTKLRSDEWLKENLNNPLRHWDGSEFVPKSKYNKSVALWKDTRRRILEEANKTEIDFSLIKDIAVEYIEGFNKLDRRSPFIETEEREDIFAAFEQILDEANISERREEIIQAMDDKRDW